MNRGNPTLTGVVQASGLRHFQRIKWELEGQFAVHLTLVAGPDLIYAIWLTGRQTEIRAIEQETGVIRWHWKPAQDEYAGQAHLYLDQDLLYYPVRSVQAQAGTNLAVLREAFLYAFDAQTGQVARRAIREIKEQAKVLYRTLNDHQRELERQGVDDRMLLRTIKEEQRVTAAEIAEYEQRQRRAYGQSDAEYDKCERYCRKQQALPRQLLLSA